MKNQAVMNKVSSPRNVVGDLLLTWPYYKKDFSLCNTTTQSAEDSPQRHWGMTSFFNKKAFTLIELLVVVLIIGILSAVALPQYQKAVYKARATEAVTMLKSITDAEEVYYLTNGEYTADLDALGVTLPEGLRGASGSEPLFDNKYSFHCDRKTECMAKSKNTNLPDFQFNFRTGRNDANAGKFYCNLGSDDTKSEMAKSICQSMGVVDSSRTESWAAGKYFVIN